MPSSKPLIVQSDGSLLLDVHETSFENARGEISAYAELEKSPEHFHTFRITSLSLWNAASGGWTAPGVIQSLQQWSRYEVPENIIQQVKEILNRWGKIRLKESSKDSELILETEDEAILQELKKRKKLQNWMYFDGEVFRLNSLNRGTIKAELIRMGFPVTDEAPLKEGSPFPFQLREITANGNPLKIRNYQDEAKKAFLGTGQPGTGFGTVVMPCGSGKTVVGISIMAALGTHTLILTTNVAAVHQWRAEILDKTDIQPEALGEYSGDKKEIRPITLATYQVLTWRAKKGGPYPHLKLFGAGDWGLIIYDEVHLLPAPIFRITAEIQTLRRLGLTATLLREDGAEQDVFSLVGPKRFDIPWKQLEQSGWIAEARCYEIRIDLPSEDRIPYAMADRRQKVRLAAENLRKIAIAEQLIKNRQEDFILVIGQYINQLKAIARHLGVPLITGKTPNARREEIYEDFRQGKERIIVVSKVANFAIDLPDASVAIQLSGSFGSRQEEAQRLGRILRPKKRDSWFYSLVSRGTLEEEYAAKRQRFLSEQGYRYKIDIWDESSP